MRLAIDDAVAFLRKNRNLDFVQLIVAIGLEPSKDFRHVDLSGADFSHQDLSVFNFTGASLLGCNFDGAILGKAILDKAAFDHSELSRALDYRQRFGIADAHQHPTDAKRYLSDVVSAHGIVAALAALRARANEINPADRGDALLHVAASMNGRDAFAAAEIAAEELYGEQWRFRDFAPPGLVPASKQFFKQVASGGASDLIQQLMQSASMGSISATSVIALMRGRKLPVPGAFLEFAVDTINRPMWRYRGSGQHDFYWLMGLLRRALECRSPMRPDDFMMVTQMTANPFELREVLELMAQHEVPLTENVLRDAARSRGSTLEITTDVGDILAQPSVDAALQALFHLPRNRWDNSVGDHFHDLVGLAVAWSPSRRR